MHYGRDKLVTVGTHNVIVLYKVIVTANNLDCIMNRMPGGQEKMCIGYRKLVYFYLWEIALSVMVGVQLEKASKGYRQQP